MPDFFDAEGEGFPDDPPRGVYAALAESEPDGEGGFIRQYECVDSLRFDNANPAGVAVVGYWAQAPISIIEYHARRGDQSLLASAEENDVLQLEINDEGRGQAIEQYFSMFGPPALRYVEASRSTKRIKIAPPEAAFPAASRTQLVAALSSGDAHDNLAAVYDVGHGNCNALLDKELFPRLYYDIGGGVNYAQSSYPRQLERFCVTQYPTIVLSHWDWDHWSSAMRTAGADVAEFARDAVWIVPRQAIGPVHASFLERLIRTATVLFWDDAIDVITSPGGLQLGKCKGRPRNDSGLALRAPMPWAQGAAILMVGDCSYRHLPWDEDEAVAALVVAHHGGLNDGGDPPPPAFANARWVVSCGNPNRYHHPLQTTLGEHEARGWTNAAMRETRNRTGDFGHVLIADPTKVQTFPQSTMCTGGSCQLQMTQ